MSKIGVHVSSGNRRGFGDFLKKCANAGSPVPVVFTVDQNVWPDIEQFSPDTVVVFRTQPRVYRGKKQGGGLDGPPDAYVVDATEAAQEWMKVSMPTWQLNPANYYAPINEQDPGLPGYTWLNTFTLECLRIADDNGFKLALYAFSSGNPRDGQSQHDLSTLEDKWHELVPSMQYAKQHDHILLLHEYGFSSPEMRDQADRVIAPATTLQASAPYLALRYRRSYRYLQQFDADPPLVISEAGAGVGGLSGISPDVWLNDVKWYDGELMKDRVVIGCCMYQLGGAENIKDQLPSLGNYVAQTPTVPPLSGALPVIPEVEEPGVIVPPPEPPTEPPTKPPTEPPTEPPVEPPPVITPTPPATLDFDVRLVSCRPNPDQRNGIILTFQIDATGGSGTYTYTCEGQPLAGPIRDRPATRHGAVVESYTVTSSDGQTKQRKFFFAASTFPC